ncbi:hypothetical protein [Actinomycetospora sp. CA-053990]|uniref:hypothetical protein n=1 Tax=Actinomycetospora sp. CA-053990 TaxID=3239891 RepID=UPI003D89B2B3
MRRERRGAVLGVLLALALGAALALWLILVAHPVGAHAEDGGAGVPDAPATPAAVETVGPAVVITSNSCIADDPRDVVAVEGPGGRRLMPLDGCGTPVGSKLTVRMAFVGTEPAADTPARVLGTGSAAALAATEPAESPLTGRLAILLTGVAGLGMAGLLVAVVRERSRRPAARAAAPPARPTRTTTTTAAPAQLSTGPLTGAPSTAPRRVPAGRRRPDGPPRSTPDVACRLPAGAPRAGSPRAARAARGAGARTGGPAAGRVARPPVRTAVRLVM